MRTVHAPHSPLPHPILVPVNLNLFRKTWTRVSLAPTSNSYAVPFTTNLTLFLLIGIIVRFPLENHDRNRVPLMASTFSKGLRKKSLSRPLRFLLKEIKEPGS